MRAAVGASKRYAVRAFGVPGGRRRTDVVLYDLLLTTGHGQRKVI